MKDISRSYNRIVIVTVDTDLVVIALAVFLDLSLDEIWVEYNSGKDGGYQFISMLES